MIDGQEFLTEFLEAGRATIAQDTMKDGFATLVDSEGHPYVANLNEKEKARYKETKKPLSQVKKEKGEEGKKEPEAKKTEEKKTEEKSEKKGAEEKISFKDRLKKIVNLPFTKSKSESPYVDYDKDYTERVFSKLDPNDENSQKALNDLEEAIKKGHASTIREITNSVSTYTYDPEGYKRSLKSSERIIKKAHESFGEMQEKLKNLYEKEKEKFLPEFKRRIKELTDKELSDKEARQRMKKIEESGGFTGIFPNNNVFKTWKNLNDARQLTENLLEDIKNYNPARGVKSWIALKKDTLKRYKDDIKSFFIENNLAMDSADFAEIQSLLNELDNGNNGLDLFINKVNIER